MAFAPIVAGISAAVGAVGAIRQGNATAKAAKTNALFQQRNAVIARQQAAEDADRSRRAARRRLGALRAGFGASGVSLEGSPLDVLEDQAMESELDALTIQYQGELSAIGLESEAALSRERARASKTAGYLKAGSSLLTGAADVYSSLPSGETE